jgi:DNA ligase-1
MRIKDFETEEAEVVDFSEAQENLNPVICNALGQTERSTSKAGKLGKGMIGNLTVRRASGEEILIGPGKLSHNERQHYFENPSHILGKTVTFSYFPYGSFNKPRFALFENFRAEEDL